MASKDVRVIVVGDVVCDEWRFVAHGSRNPENAGLVLVSQPDAEFIVPGGAGLTALCLRQLGAQVMLFGRLDHSRRADEVWRGLVEADVAMLHMPRFGLHTMPVKVRYLNEAHNIVVRHDIENYDNPVPDLFDIDAFERALRISDCVVVSDYDKGFLDGRRSQIIKLCRDRCVPVFVDCKEKHLTEYAGANCVKINHKTATDFIAGFTLPNTDPCKIVQRVVNADLTVITNGTAGISWQTRDMETPRLESFAIKHSAGNAVGAGDAFMAGMVMWFLMSDTAYAIDKYVAPDGLLVGHLAANRKITWIYPRLSPAQALVDFCEYRFAEKPSAKIIDQKFFAAFARACEKVGKRVVFTNGCFDVLHAGHMHLLREARAMGDVLIVAMDSDANVRRLKGQDRPVQDEKTRAEILAGLQMVDAVTVFTDKKDNLTLRSLIKKCRPAVLAKGGDYRPEDCVGWAEVTKRKNPGRVVCCDVLPGFSTTTIINKVRGSNV